MLKRSSSCPEVENQGRNVWHWVVVGVCVYIKGSSETRFTFVNVGFVSLINDSCAV